MNHRTKSSLQDNPMNGHAITINGKQCLAFDKDTLPHRSGVYAASALPDTKPEFYHFANYSVEHGAWGRPAYTIREACESKDFWYFGNPYWYGFAEKQEDEMTPCEQLGVCNLKHKCANCPNKNEKT